MGRTLGAGTSAEVIKQTTDTLFLVAFGFSTPIYYSSKEQVSYDGKTWLATDMQVRDPTGESPMITVFNEGTSFGDTVISEGVAGRTIQIYQRYGTQTPFMIFDGEMGEASISDFVAIECRRSPARRSPNLRVGPPNFNHVPRAGTIIVTSKGTFTLEER